MEVLELLERLKERELLLKFPLGDPEAFLSLQEKKRELLLKLSSFNYCDFEPYADLVKEVKELQDQIKPLLLSNLFFCRSPLGSSLRGKLTEREERTLF